MSQCTVSSNIAENKTNLAYNAYQAKVINALDNLFGRASQARIKQVQTLGKFSKVFMRKLKSDYAKHLGLFNPEGIKDGKGGLLFDFLMQNGMETEFEVDPVVKVDELQAYLYDKTGQLVNHSILYGKYGLSFGAVDKHIRRVIDASKKITPFQRAWYPISIFPRADRFGYISRLARKMKTLSDRQRQDTKDITKKYTAHRKAAKLFIENLIDTGKLNINNGAMDGLNPRDGLYTVNGERIILHKKVEGGYQVSIIRDKEGRNIVEKDENGADIPLNQVPYSELEKVFLPQEELKSTTEDIKQALIQKYVDELVNDLSHGQTREVKFQTIPTGYKQREKWKRESQDGIIVTDILDAMAEKKYTKEDKKKGLIPEGQDVGDVKEEAEFAPDVYTQNVITKGADGVAQARTIRYVMVKQGIRDKTGKILEPTKEEIARTKGPSTWDIIYDSMTPIEKGQWNAEKRKQGMNGKTGDVLVKEEKPKPKPLKPDWDWNLAPWYDYPEDDDVPKPKAMSYADFLKQTKSKPDPDLDNGLGYLLAMHKGKI